MILGTLFLLGRKDHPDTFPKSSMARYIIITANVCLYFGIAPMLDIPL